MLKKGLRITSFQTLFFQIGFRFRFIIFIISPRVCTFIAFNQASVLLRMKKKLLFSLLKISIATLIATLLFPYFKNFLTEFFNAVSLFFLLSSIIIPSLSILIISLIRSKKVTYNIIFNTIFLLIQIVFAMYSMTILNIYGVILILIFLEALRFFKTQTDNTQIEN